MMMHALVEVLLHARVSAGKGKCTPRVRRGDEHAHALGSVAVGAPADEMNIVPTRCADSAGASSIIESDSISVSDAARGDKTIAGGGSCPDEDAVVLVVAAMAPMISGADGGAALDGERDEQCADGAASRTVGDEVDRGVDRLARALVPQRVHGDACAWVLCVRSGVCGGAGVC